MKYYIVTALMMLLAIPGITQEKKPDAVLGHYWSPKKDGKIEIFKSGNKYMGKFTWGKNPRKDTNNPDPARRDQPLTGMVFLKDFVYDNGTYTGGTIYDPNNGKTYQCKMWLQNGDLKVRGFIGISLLGRTELFERVR